MKILFLINLDVSRETATRVRIMQQMIGIREKGIPVLALVFTGFRSFLLRPIANQSFVRHCYVKGIHLIVLPSLPFNYCPGICWKANVYYAKIITQIALYLSRADVLHATGTNAGNIASQLSACRAKIVVDITGVAAEELQYRYGSSTLLRQKQALALNEAENKIIKRADHLLCVSDSMAEYLMSKHKLASLSYTRVPCVADCCLFRKNDGSRVKIRQILGLDNRVVILYVGSARAYQMISAMCCLFVQIHHCYPESVFLILTLDDVKSFEKEILRHGVPGDSYRIFALSHCSVPEYMMAGDIGLLIRENNIINRVASPTKFGEYIAAGVPVMSTASVGDISLIIQEKQLGIVVDLEALNIAVIIEFIREVRSAREVWKNRCVQYSQAYYSWESYNHVMENVYRRLVSHDMKEFARVKL